MTDRFHDKHPSRSLWAPSPHIAALATATVAGILVIWVVWQKLVLYNGNPHSFVDIDGFFVYQLAKSLPSLNAPLDIPAYRAQRILLSALAFPFGPLIAWALISINIVSATAGSYALARIAHTYGCPTFIGILFSGWIGTLFAVQFDLTEVLTYTLVLWGIWKWECEQPVATGIFLGIAMLAKETAVLYGVAFILGSWATSSWRERVRMAVLTMGPITLWQLVLIVCCGEPGLTAALHAGAPGDGMMLMMGLINAKLASPWAWPIQIGWVLFPGLLAVIWGGVALIVGKRSPIAWCLLLNGLFVISLPPSSTEYLVHSARIGLAVIVALTWAILALRRPQLALLWMGLILAPLVSFQPGMYF